jgi:probable addiction module antidote protein
MAITTSPDVFAETIRTPLGMAECLEACIEETDGDATLIIKALGVIARDQGMTQLDRNWKLPRESLYKANALYRECGQNSDTILRVVSALGLKLSASERSEAEMAWVLIATRRPASAACGDATPSYKPPEWTGRRRVCFDSNNSIPAILG